METDRHRQTNRQRRRRRKKERKKKEKLTQFKLHKYALADSALCVITAPGYDK